MAEIGEVKVTLTDIVLALNILADIYLKFKRAGVDITPEKLVSHINSLETEAKENNEKLGIIEGE